MARVPYPDLASVSPEVRDLDTISEV